MIERISKLPVYSKLLDVREKRKQDYLQQAEKLYPGMKSITNDEYRAIRKEFENGDKTALKRLADKSIKCVIDSVAYLYAKYDIEPIVPFEDGLSVSFMKFCSSVLKFDRLPKYRAEFETMTTNYYIFNILLTHYANEKLIKDRVVCLEESELIKEIDKKIACVISTYKEDKEHFEIQLTKVLKKLTSREVEILKAKYGLGNGEEKTFDQVSEDFNLSRTRVDQILTSALKKLRKSNNKKHLVDIGDLNL